MESSNVNWKSKLNQKQLEKKRLTDRINQRRAREQTRRTLCELEDRIKLLSDGNYDALEKQLVTENARLRHSLDQYHSRVRDMVSWKFPQFDADEEEDEIHQSTSRPHIQQSPSTRCPDRDPASASALNDPHLDLVDFMGRTAQKPRLFLTHYIPSPPQIPMSILFQTAPLLKRAPSTSAVEELLSVDLIESVMVWKLNNNYRYGFEFLFQHLGLDKEPHSLSLEFVNSQLSGPDFFSRLIAALVCDEPFRPSAESCNRPSQSRPDTVSEMARQRRAIAYCCFAMFSPFRRYFRTVASFLSQFWTFYKFATFLALPTEQNLKKTPPWILPTRAQFLFDHPGAVDYMAWPGLRSILARTWKQYDLTDLCIRLSENLKLRVDFGVFWDESTLLSPTAEETDIEIDPRFEAFIHDLDNICTDQELSLHYPELAPSVNCVSEDASSLSWASTSSDTTATNSQPVEATDDNNFMPGWPSGFEVPVAADLSLPDSFDLQTGLPVGLDTLPGETFDPPLLGTPTQSFADVFAFRSDLLI